MRRSYAGSALFLVLYENFKNLKKNLKVVNGMTAVLNITFTKNSIKISF